MSLPSIKQDLTQGQMIWRSDYSEGWGRGRSGTSRGSSPAGLCWSLAHLVQCGPGEPKLDMDPNMDPGTDDWLLLKLDREVHCYTKVSINRRWPSRSQGLFGFESAIDHWLSGTDAREYAEKPLREARWLIKRYLTNVLTDGRVWYKAFLCESGRRAVTQTLPAAPKSLGPRRQSPKEERLWCLAINLTPSRRVKTWGTALWGSRKLTVRHECQAVCWKAFVKLMGFLAFQRVVWHDSLKTTFGRKTSIFSFCWEHAFSPVLTVCTILFANTFDWGSYGGVLYGLHPIFSNPKLRSSSQNSSALSNTRVFGMPFLENMTLRICFIVEIFLSGTRIISGQP